METWFEINRKETRARIHDDNNVGHNDKQGKQMEAHGLRKSVVHLDTGGTNSSGTRRLQEHEGIRGNNRRIPRRH